MAKGTNVFRDRAATEGSVIDNIPPNGAPCLSTTTPACQNENTWTNIRTGATTAPLRNGRTGAKRLISADPYGAQPWI
jgi:hypothetical protein